MRTAPIAGSLRGRVARRLLPFAVALALAAAAAIPASAATTPSYSVDHGYDSYTQKTTVMRWTPCLRIAGVTTTHSISYVVNTGGDATRVTLVQQALKQVTAISGLQFRYLGKTSYVPRFAVLHYATGARKVFEAAQQRRATGAELVIGWVSASSTNMFSGSEAGVGTVSWTGSRTSQTRIVEGAAVIKLGVRLRSGFTTGASIGSLLLHEIGHAVGLGHSSSPSQIMYPTLGTYTPARYGSGDSAGLRLVGRPAGCFTTKSLAPPDPVAIARAAGVTVTL